MRGRKRGGTLSKELKKVGIITLNGYYNYGNKLQNYALQEVIKELGFTVSTIIIKDINTKQKYNLKDRIIIKTNKLTKNNLEYITKKIYNKICNHIYKDSIDERTKTFRCFSKKYLNEISWYSNDNGLRKLANIYDYFVTGSDQVWNPVNQHGNSVYFLTFAPQHKRIAYAPSFGVSDIKSEYRENYKEWISEIHRLSVREDDGAKIIKALTGRDALVLVDPTLLLTKEKWLSVAKEANNKPKDKYLLTYFLGGISNKYKKQIKMLAKDNNLEVVNLGNIREKETFMTGPSEFIDYINSCSLLCTDSFHGAVFSMLMEKPFIVYERIGASLSMFSRIDTLLSKFKLESRKVENIINSEEAFDIDYSHVPSALEEERDIALSYLKEALNVKE